jgi:hypothetical protein
MITPLYLHGFGARYDLPLPLAIYLYAGITVVVVSFVLVGLFASSRGGEQAVAFQRWRAPWLARWANAGVIQVGGGVLGVLCLVVTIATGLFGSGNPIDNPSAYLVWIYLWVGMVLFAALVGNLWTLTNPFAALYTVLARLLRLPARLRPFPERLGTWPAAAVFFLIAWFELASGKASTPVIVGWAALAYTVVTLAGMVVFGARDWLDHCDAFTVLFGIAARFAPTEVERDGSGRAVEAWLRPWGAGLLTPITSGWDRIVFVILMLSNLAFDGLEGTPFWFGIASAYPPVAATLGGLWRPVVYTLGLLAVALVFLTVFVIFMRLVIAMGRTRVDTLAALTTFALTLVPIALVYDAAHNYTYLTVYGQQLLPTLADPFGKGWHLLPLQNFQPNQALATPELVWLVGVVLIVLGHVIAVYLAHRRAMQSFRSARRALTSQYPMLLLMVAYTFTSLWILAQPTTNG